MKNIDKNFNGTLIYLLSNSIFAYDQLCEINKELIKGMHVDSTADVNYLGAMNRMIQDYLIIRVAGLFDEDKQNREVVSFGKLFSKNEIYKNLKEQEVIRYIIFQRNNVVAHFNEKGGFTYSSKICNSDLKEILLKLKTLIS